MQVNWLSTLTGRRISISGACYPEGHVDAENIDKDIDNLKIKVEAEYGI